MTISTGNLVEDFVANSAAIFENNMERLNIREVYKEDVLLIPVVPSIAVSCQSFWNDLRTLGKNNVRYTYNFIGSIWYYHSTQNPDVRPNLVMRHAYSISEHIIKNASLNSFLTNLRAVIRSCAYSPRYRSGQLYSAARILYVAPYLQTISEIS